MSDVSNEYIYRPIIILGIISVSAMANINVDESNEKYK